MNIQVPRTKSCWATGRAERNTGTNQRNTTAFPLWFADALDSVSDDGVDLVTGEIATQVPEQVAYRPNSDGDLVDSTTSGLSKVSQAPVVFLTGAEERQLRKVEKKLREIVALEQNFGLLNEDEANKVGQKAKLMAEKTSLEKALANMQAPEQSASKSPADAHAVVKSSDSDFDDASTDVVSKASQSPRAFTGSEEKQLRKVEKKLREIDSLEQKFGLLNQDEANKVALKAKLLAEKVSLEKVLAK